MPVQNMSGFTAARIFLKMAFPFIYSQKDRLKSHDENEWKSQDTPYTVFILTLGIKLN